MAEVQTPEITMASPGSATAVSGNSKSSCPSISTPGSTVATRKRSSSGASRSPSNSRGSSASVSAAKTCALNRGDASARDPQPQGGTSTPSTPVSSEKDRKHRRTSNPIITTDLVASMTQEEESFVEKSAQSTRPKVRSLPHSKTSDRTLMTPKNRSSSDSTALDRKKLTPAASTATYPTDYPTEVKGLASRQESPTRSSTPSARRERHHYKTPDEVRRHRSSTVGGISPEERRHREVLDVLRSIKGDTTHFKDPSTAEKHKVTKFKFLGGAGSGCELWVVSVNGWMCVMKELEISPKCKNPPTKDIYKFKREISLHASFNHPNIVQYLFHQQSDYHWQLFMARYRCSLAKVIERRKLSKQGPFSPKEVVDIMLGIIRGLAYLHTKCCMHRDLKPGNVLVNTRGDEVIHVALADFDQSKDIALANMLTPQVGTPDYNSPEVNGLKPYSYEADMWSAGIIMGELMTLEPWKAGTDEAQKAGNRPHFPTSSYECASLYRVYTRLVCSAKSRYSAQTALERLAEVRAELENKEC